MYVLFIKPINFELIRTLESGNFLWLAYNFLSAFMILSEGDQISVIRVYRNKSSNIVHTYFGKILILFRFTLSDGILIIVVP